MVQLRTKPVPPTLEELAATGAVDVRPEDVTQVRSAKLPPLTHAVRVRGWQQPRC